MDYIKIYNKIIENARNQFREKSRGIYYENHHIIPRCLNGNNKKENKILLTAKEHFICHKLLTYIYPNNRKIVCAFHFMTFSEKNKLRKSARDYEYARKLISIIPISEETRKKLSDSFKGDKNPQWGKPGFALGKKMTEEAKKKLSIAKLGEKNYQYGKKKELSPMWGKRKKMIKFVCKYCKKEMPLNAYNRWHGEKCENKGIYNRFNRFSNFVEL